MAIGPYEESMRPARSKRSAYRFDSPASCYRWGANRPDASVPYHRPISVHHPEVAFHHSLFTIPSAHASISLPTDINEVQTMANLEHLKILKQGASTWNKWREQNPGINPDLRTVSLIDADLRSSDLSGADLFEADFSMAILDERTSLGRQPSPHAPHRRLPRVERSRPLPEVVRTALARPQGVDKVSCQSSVVSIQSSVIGNQSKAINGQRTMVGSPSLSREGGRAFTDD